jgi:hypothetical protein
MFCKLFAKLSNVNEIVCNCQQFYQRITIQMRHLIPRDGCHSENDHIIVENEKIRSEKSVCYRLLL